MKRKILSFVLVVISATLFSQPIQVTILNSEPVTGITNIQYEFTGTSSSYDISVEVSFDGIPYLPVPEADLSGDLNNVAPGVRNIVWNGAASFPNYYHLQTLIRITATPNFVVCGDQLSDINGNVYNTVLIGTQCWMKENLKTTKDADGNPITRYCYNNDPSNCAIYGGLYTWTTAMNGAASSNNVPSGVQGICPDGWHLPGDAEWTVLTNYVSSQPGFRCSGISSYIAKSLAAKTNWQSSLYLCAVGNDPNVNNATGFSILPCGYLLVYGSFYSVGEYGFSWSSTEYSFIYAWGRSLYNYNPDVHRHYDNKEYGYSVRCLRD